MVARGGGGLLGAEDLRGCSEGAASVLMMLRPEEQGFGGWLGEASAEGLVRLRPKKNELRLVAEGELRVARAFGLRVGDGDVRPMWRLRRCGGVLGFSGLQLLVRSARTAPTVVVKRLDSGYRVPFSLGNGPKGEEPKTQVYEYVYCFMNVYMRE